MRTLLVLILLLLGSYESISQTYRISGDTSLRIDRDRDSVTCVPNSKLRAAVRLIERGKLDAQKVVLLEEQVAVMGLRIANKDSLLAVWQRVDENSQARFRNYELDIRNLERQNEAREVIITGLQRDVKRQRRRTVLTGIAGLVLTGTAIYFSNQ